MTQVLNYGGGQATVAMCIAIAQGKLPRPDRIVIADTGRENPSTWDYLDTHIRPLFAPLDLTVEIAPHTLATVDLYAQNGQLLLPVFTKTGKLNSYCSSEWKKVVIQRYLRSVGITSATSWIGFTLDEQRRVKAERTGPWKLSYPLIDLLWTKADCLALIESAGLPIPPRSACFMCPHKSNEEWRFIRDTYPEQWEAACQIDEDTRAEDQDEGHEGVWLHRSLVPLREAPIDVEDRKLPLRQCGLGHCFI